MALLWRAAAARRLGLGLGRQPSVSTTVHGRRRSSSSAAAETKTKGASPFPVVLGFGAGVCFCKLMEDRREKKKKAVEEFINSLDEEVQRLQTLNAEFPRVILQLEQLRSSKQPPQQKVVTTNGIVVQDQAPSPSTPP